MFIVHPDDRSTDFLTEIYKGIPEAVRFDGRGEGSIEDGLTNAADDKVLTVFLGHGTPYGLLDVTGASCYTGYLISEEVVPLLKGRKNLFGMWCYANKFAESYRLNGLWSGMIISEVMEANWMGIKTTQKEVTEENWKLSKRVRQCLDNYPLSEIPDVLRTLDDRKSPLTKFNYSSWYFYGQAEQS